MLNSILSHFIVALFLQYLSILTVTCYYCIPSNHGGNSRAPGWSTSFRRHYWLGPCHKRLAWNCCCPRISCFGCMLIANSCVEPIRCHRVTIVSVTQYVTISWRSQRMGTIATGARWMNHDNFYRWAMGFMLFFPFEDMLRGHPLEHFAPETKKLTKVSKGHRTSRNHSCLLKNLSLPAGIF